MLERIPNPRRPARGAPKLPFHIPRMFRLIRRAIAPYPKAMLFELRDLGFGSPFQQLVACVLSIRTLDEVSREAALRLLEKVKSPKDLTAMPLDSLARTISPCTFAYQKARNLQAIAHILIRDHGGETPCDFDALLTLPGIGPKCANLVLGIGCGQARIGVDVHVHRITNRWGYISADTPEKSLAALERKLPRARAVEINELLVPFGKHICLGRRPRCSTCPVLAYCRQVGVTAHL